MKFYVFREAAYFWRLILEACSVVYILLGRRFALLLGAYMFCELILVHYILILLFLTFAAIFFGIRSLARRRRKRLEEERSAPPERETGQLLKTAVKIPQGKGEEFLPKYPRAPEVSEQPWFSFVYESVYTDNGSFHLRTGGGKVYSVFRDGEMLYFCVSGTLSRPQSAYKKDVWSESVEERYGSDRKNFRLPVSEVSRVSIRELSYRNYNESQVLKLTFHTAKKDYRFYDFGMIEGRELERLLREGMGLAVEGSDYSPTLTRGPLARRFRSSHAGLMMASGLAALWLLVSNYSLWALAALLAIIFLIFLHECVTGRDDGDCFASAAALTFLLCVGMFLIGSDLGDPDFWRPMLPYILRGALGGAVLSAVMLRARRRHLYCWQKYIWTVFLSMLFTLGLSGYRYITRLR